MSIASHLSPQDIAVMMDEVRDICSTTNAIRAKNTIRNRQPLPSMTIADPRGKFSYLSCLPELVDIIKDECNVKEVRLVTDNYAVILQGRIQ